jgi:hypothetical protein
VFVRGDVNVKPIASMTRDIKVDFWLDYLYKQREAVLGVPKIFLGECITGDALISTAAGLKPLEEIEAGAKVLTFVNGNMKLKKVLRKFKQGKKKVYILKTAAGKHVKATGNHKFLKILN